jgi:hypothetical protein
MSMPEMFELEVDFQKLFAFERGRTQTSSYEPSN